MFYHPFSAESLTTPQPSPAGSIAHAQWLKHSILACQLRVDRFHNLFYVKQTAFRESVATLEDCYLAGMFVSGQNKSG